MLWGLALLVTVGCSKEEKTAPSVSEPPVLQMIHPRPRTIVRVVGQPSFVQSYERTSIYAKMTAYLDRWNVDIGDTVRKGDVVAELFVPELREQWETKKAAVILDKEQVRFAKKEVEVASAQVKAAQARLEEAKSILGKYDAEVKRWKVQVSRLAREVDRQVVAPQILLESENELNADVAARDAATAAIVKRAAELLADEAALARAEVNVGVARARVLVAESEAKRLEAWVGYLKLFAPYDGVVVARNANTWDFVLPQTGDPSAENRAPHLSPNREAAPIYVIERTDIVRIYVDVPERDADHIHIGSDARVKLWAYKDKWFPATVTRISWALNAKSRTMRAEIDLPNPETQVRPGMYAYGKIIVKHRDALSVPKSALTHAGGKSFIWRYDNGRARRTEIHTGVEDGKWIELTNRHLDTKSAIEEEWAPITSAEKVLTGSKLSTLMEGQRVKLSDKPPPNEDGDTAEETSEGTESE